MRDQVYFKATESITTYKPSSAPSTISGPRVVIDKKRADAISTNRLPDGSYGFPTPYDAFITTSSVTPGIGRSEERVGASWQPVTVVGTGFWRESDGYEGVSIGRFPVIPTSVVSKARNKAIEAIKANDLNLGDVAADLKDSFHTIVDLLRDVAHIVKNFKGTRNFQLGAAVNGHVPYHRPRQHSRALARQWLKYQYGIKPIMNSIYDTLQLMEEGLKLPMASVKVVQLDDSWKLPPSGSDIVEISGSLKRGVEIGYTYGIKSPELFQLYRFGLSSPAGILWEYTTLSFVVDWFLHVGDFLSAFTIPNGLNLVTGYQTDFLETTITRRRQLHLKPSFNVRTVAPGYCTHTTHTRCMRRHVLPWIAPPLPYLDLGLNTQQAVSALALIAVNRP